MKKNNGIVRLLTAGAVWEEVGKSRELFHIFLYVFDFGVLVSGRAEGRLKIWNEKLSKIFKIQGKK